MKVIPFEKAHALDILDRNVRERDAWISGHGDFENIIETWKTGGPAYTIIIDDQVIMSAGVVLMGWNRGEAWTLLSTLFFKHPKTCFKQVLYRLEEIIYTHKLKRVQALVSPEFEKGVRFVEHLGFEKEGTLKAFGPNNEDLVMFGRICQ